MAGAAFNWAYFSTLGVPGFLQFFSTSDEVSSALAWLPGIVLAYTWDFVATNLSTNSAQANARLYDLISRRWSTVIIAVAGLLMFGFSGPSDYYPAIGMVGLLWVSVSRRVISQFGHDNLPHKTFIFFLVPGLMMLVLAEGNREGLAGLSGASHMTTIEIRGNPKLNDVRPIRYLARGVIYETSNGEIGYTQWNGGGSIKTRLPKLDRRYRVCVYLDLFCSGKDTFGGAVRPIVATH